MEDSRWAASLPPAALINELLERTPPELQHDIRERVEREWALPPIDSLNAKFGSRWQTGSKLEAMHRARQLLFGPRTDCLAHSAEGTRSGIDGTTSSLSDIDCIVGMLSGAPEDAEATSRADRAANKTDHSTDTDSALAPLRLDRLQVSALGMLYLVHLSSSEFIRAFVLRGGLTQLLQLFSHPNLLVRGQAIECFLQVTAHPDLDWFAEKDATSSTAALRRELLHVGQRQDERRDSPEAWAQAALFPLPRALFVKGDSSAFPNESFLSLEILAFWLSWVRKVFLHSEPLQLPVSGLAALQRWSTRASAVCDVSKEEVALATALYNDFSRFPPLAPPHDRATDSGSDGGGGGRGSKSFAEPTVSVGSKASHTPHQRTVHGSSTGSATSRVPQTKTPDSCKTVGNACFAKQDYCSAFSHYSEGIALCGDLHVEASSLVRETHATLLTNRAATLLKLLGIQDDGLPPQSLLHKWQVSLTATSSIPTASVQASSTTTSTAAHEPSSSPTVSAHSVETAFTAAHYSSHPLDAISALLLVIADCEDALSLQPDNVKALFRKGQALAGLGHIQDSLQCARSALALCQAQTCAGASGASGGGSGTAAGRSRHASLISSILAFLTAASTLEEANTEGALALLSAQPASEAKDHSSVLSETGSIGVTTAASSHSDVAPGVGDAYADLISSLRRRAQQPSFSSSSGSTSSAQLTLAASSAPKPLSSEAVFQPTDPRTVAVPSPDVNQDGDTSHAGSSESFPSAMPSGADTKLLLSANTVETGPKSSTTSILPSTAVCKEASNALSETWPLAREKSDGALPLSTTHNYTLPAVLSGAAPTPTPTTLRAGESGVSASAASASSRATGGAASALDALASLNARGAGAKKTATSSSSSAYLDNLLRR